MTADPKPPTEMEMTLEIIDLLTKDDSVLWKSRTGRLVATIAGAEVVIDYEPGVMGIESRYNLNIRDQNNVSVIGDGLSISQSQQNYDKMQALYRHAQKCSVDSSKTLERILGSLKGIK